MLSLAPATPGIVADIGLPTMKQGQLHGNGSQYYWFRVLDICVLVVVFGKIFFQIICLARFPVREARLKRGSEGDV